MSRNATHNNNRNVGCLGTRSSQDATPTHGTALVQRVLQGFNYGKGTKAKIIDEETKHDRRQLIVDHLNKLKEDQANMMRLLDEYAADFDDMPGQVTDFALDLAAGLIQHASKLAAEQRIREQGR